MSFAYAQRCTFVCGMRLLERSQRRSGLTLCSRPSAGLAVPVPRGGGATRTACCACSLRSRELVGPLQAAYAHRHALTSCPLQQVLSEHTHILGAVRDLQRSSKNSCRSLTMRSCSVLVSQPGAGLNKTLSASKHLHL